MRTCDPAGRRSVVVVQLYEQEEAEAAAAAPHIPVAQGQ